MALLSRSPARSKLAYFECCARQNSTMSQFKWLRRLGPGFLGSPPFDRGIVGLGVLARLLFWGRRLARLGLAVCRGRRLGLVLLAPSPVGLGFLRLLRLVFGCLVLRRLVLGDRLRN